ncbi:MAG: hypothetical protein V3T31_07835, partial [candidate division Zixibacteria bacterium]
MSRNNIFSALLKPISWLKNYTMRTTNNQNSPKADVRKQKARRASRLAWLAQIHPTSIMIYGGTLLLSILSFFTTFYGLKIVVSYELALMGSLGLQSAMLGIAWNLIHVNQRRSVYVAVFSLAAIFSIFFSYANFNSN